MMHNREKFIVCGTLLVILFMASCGDGNWETSTGTRQRFDYDLQGTWVSNDTAIYSGTLTISNNWITITGYGEDQTPRGGDDNNRPFKSFTKRAALKGYSEEGKFFIEDAGLVQQGIPYTYWYNNPPPDFRKVKFIRFTFGNRDETLQWSGDSNF